MLQMLHGLEIQSLYLIKMFEFVEKVIYINLAHRTDRKQEVEAELLKYFPVEKILRFDAFTNEIPEIGCTNSHIAALEIANSEGWNNVLIVEDDSMWSDMSGYSILEEKVKKYDVIMLGSTFASYSKDYRIRSAHSGNAYLVAKHYYNVLVTNLKDGRSKLTETGNRVYMNDSYWKKLQQKDEWYCIIPSLMVQRPSYSDISKTFGDYVQHFS
jgi:glycosyl transferase family 25